MFLDEAIGSARRDMEARRRSVPFPVIEKLAKQRPETPSFRQAIGRRDDGPLGIIAEIKRSSPSRGFIRNGFSVEKLTRGYIRGGASAVSVLTEAEYFRGSLLDLSLAASVSRIPVLRKDFIVDPYQVVESRCLGASALLLIAAALPDDTLEELMGFTREMAMDALVEVHDEEELERALEAGADMVGINNRNLKTLEVDLGVTERLLPLAPEGVVKVSESGISDRDQARRLREVGVDAILVGEALMLADDPAVKVTELRGGRRGGGEVDGVSLSGANR